VHGKVTALVGAQFGSEGKGLVAAKMAEEYEVHVRTGAPNAGHTYYTDAGFKIVARSVPCGAINQNATLVIGAGALIDIDLLIQEIAFLDKLGWAVSDRLLLDPQAAVIDPIRHHQYEGGTRGQAHEMIGSTGEGVGPARMAKIARGTFPSDLAWAKIELAGEHPAVASAVDHGLLQLGDTARMLNELYDAGANILLEGTQGSGLSLVHGPWPKVTSTDTNAAQLAVDAGLAPSIVSDVVLVARTFPIRVAGASGPLPNEATWEEIGQTPEKTTVTRKERRVAWFNEATVQRAIMLNRPTGIALTFLDYLFPDDYRCSDWYDLTQDARDYVAKLELALGVFITDVGTGPDMLVGNPGVDRVRDGRFLNSAVPDDDHDPIWPSRERAYGVEEVRS
jgi:adenylosuccinate synthase